MVFEKNTAFELERSLKLKWGIKYWNEEKAGVSYERNLQVPICIEKEY